MPRLLIAALAVTVSLLAASPSVAHASSPCSQRVIDDWTKDGKIDGHYTPHCLRQAYNSVPEDLRDYSSILDDINAALLGGVGTKNGPNGGLGEGGKAGKAAATAEAKRRAEQAVPHAGSSGSIPENSRTIPLPLLILAAIALAALLAAASPPVIQRVRARFPRARPAAQTDRS
jgi:hypothetical protein